MLDLFAPTKRNRRFENCHKGECCYIFGNGISLKDMDLTCFSDNISIGCNYLFFHKDFSKLNVKYYTEPPPYWYYPFWRQPYTKKLIANKLSLLQRKYQKIFYDVNYFVNLSNLPVLFGKNIFYIHHFGAAAPSFKNFDLSGSFYYNGALEVMVGMAIYMGFDKAYLIGCDYTHSPQRILHYYEKGKGQNHNNDDYKKNYFLIAKELIDLITITNSESSSKTIQYRSYSEYTGIPETFNENYDLVDPSVLAIINEWGGYHVY